MTPEAQRIAIAEACGWKEFHSDGPPDFQMMGYQKWDQPDDAPKSVPDYLGSLDAIESACEKLLTHNELERQWSRELTDIHIKCEASKGKFFLRHRSVTRATAPQRCEALLRTIGKWEE